jgi:hypothetical protein
LTDEELDVVRDALSSRPTWLELARVLQSKAHVEQTDALRMLAVAYVYDLVEEAHEGRRATAGGPYATMWEDESGSYPPRPTDVVAEVRTLWRATRDAIDDPIVGARIGDLLFVTEGMPAHEDARQGAQALLRLTDEQAWTPLDRALCMSRALELLRALNDRAALAAAVPDAVELADSLLDQEHPGHPGPPFIVVRALIALKPNQRPTGLDPLLDRVVARFADHEAHDTALGLAVRATADPQRRETLRRSRLQARIDAMDGAEGLAKVSLLQRAIELARAYNLTTEADALLKQQQDLPTEELGFETVEVSTEIRVDEVRQQVDLIVGSQAADLFDALRRLGSFGPPGGSNADIDAELDQQDKEHPIAGLFTHQLFGPASSAPNYIANDPESKRLLARGRQRKLYTDWYGTVLIAPMLDEAVEHHGRPTQDALTKYFATELIGAVRGERLARALELFWDQDYDAAAHLIAPRLESILRDIAQHSGITIVKPALDGRFAGVVSLNYVMGKLRALNAETEWLDYLEALLCDPLAVNLRNDIAHGIVEQIGGVNAALLIHAACYLALLRAQTAPSADQT